MACLKTLTFTTCDAAPAEPDMPAPANHNAVRSTRETARGCAACAPTAPSLRSQSTNKSLRARPAGCQPQYGLLPCRALHTVCTVHARTLTTPACKLFRGPGCGDRATQPYPIQRLGPNAGATRRRQVLHPMWGTNRWPITNTPAARRSQGGAHAVAFIYVVKNSGCLCPTAASTAWYARPDTPHAALPTAPANGGVTQGYHPVYPRHPSPAPAAQKLTCSVCCSAPPAGRSTLRRARPTSYAYLAGAPSSSTPAGRALDSNTSSPTPRALTCGAPAARQRCQPWHALARVSASGERVSVPCSTKRLNRRTKGRHARAVTVRQHSVLGRKQQERCSWS